MTNKIDCDAIVVGAGFAGLALIHHLKKTGISVKVLDKASEIGGTWAWNRYPGAATDSEGYYYCLTFSKEILQEWTWSESCLLYTSPSPRDLSTSRMPSSA